MRTAKVQPAGKPHPVCFVLVAFFARTDYRCVSQYSHEPLPFLSSVSLPDGSVLLYRHLDQFLLSTLLPSPSLESFRNCARTCDVASIHYCTCIGFHGPIVISCRLNLGSTPASNPLPTLSLVIITTSTYVHPILPRPSSPTAVLIDEIGAGLCCACVDWKSRWVVLGRDEAVVGIGSAGWLGVVSYEGQYNYF